MKRFLAILLSLLLMMASVPMVSAQSVPAQHEMLDGPYFVVSQTEGKRGDTIEITVSAVNNPGIVSTKVKVGYDASVLQLVEYAMGDFSEDGYSWGPEEKNPFIINWCDASDPDNTSVLLATLTFRILDDAAYGPSALSISFLCEDDVFNYDWETVPFSPLGGEVYVLYPVTGVQLDQSSLDMYNGDTAVLTADVLAEGKTDATVFWTTDDSSVVTVDDQGKVTAVGLGSATVTVTTADGGFTASCLVSVTCAHHNTTVVESVPSTCVTPGRDAYTVCDDCGERIAGSDEDLPLADHTPVVVEGYAPTCTEDGLTDGEECSVCGEVLMAQEIIPANGHSYDGVVTDPDCVNGGYTTYTCSVCGDSYIGDETGAWGHSTVMVEGYDPTCTEDGLTYGEECAVCGEVLIAQEIIPAIGHSYDGVVTEPDCVNGGYTTYTCSVCGDSYIGDEIGALGHSPVVMEGYAPTCTEEGLTDGEKCSVCDEILVAQEIIPATGHAYDAVVTEPDCMNGGYTTYTCACGDSYIGDDTAALGHTPVVVKGYAPTCTEDGLTDGEVCSVCDEILTVQDIILATGHTYDAVVTEPDCLNGGYTTYTCACGDSYIGDETDALGHAIMVVDGYAPTCTENGLTNGEECSTCGEVLVAQQIILATGHVYDDEYDAVCNECGFERDALCKHEYVAVVTEPDCVNGGYTTYTCSACGDSYVSDAVDALGHTSVVLEGYAPTCTEDGWTDGEQCSVCGEVLVAQESIPATGHSYDAVVTAPDCLNGGYTTYTCACGDSYMGDDTAALGHTPVVVEGYAPTCSEEGLTDGEKCSVCDEILTVQNSIPATGIHVYDDDADTDCNECGAVREPAVQAGDADSNGKINNRDLGLLQQYINGYEVTVNVAAADMDGNGKINNRDLGLLQQYINSH